MIKVVGSEILKPSDDEFWVDDCVALKFSTYKVPIGAWYVRVDNFRTSLLEFKLEPDKAVIKDFSLVAFDAVHDPEDAGVVPTKPGLPEVELDGSVSLEGPMGARRADIHLPISFGLARNFAEVKFGAGS